MRHLGPILAAAVLATLPASAAAYWKPRAGIDFAIVLSETPSSVAKEADVVDIDLFETSASRVARLKAQGKRVICYMSAGSWEEWTPDHNKFPSSVIGNDLDGWPGEKYLDIRSAAVREIMKKRLDLCKKRGFAAVDPDNVDSFEIGNRTGFPLTKADAIAYLKFLATEAHARGLAIGLKNATEIARDLLDDMDFAVTEDCFDQGWCPTSRNFIKMN
jgi:hypothetical protein